MGAALWLRALLRRKEMHPRRWLIGLLSYSRFLGYIRPHLVGTTDEEFRVRRQLLALAWDPRELIVPLGKRILVLCPHPDDESIGAGGFLLAHRNLAEIHLVCLCLGEAGGSLGESYDDPKKMAEVRRAEFKRTANDLRAASVRHLDFPDGNIPIDAASAARLRSIVEAVKPDVVLLPWFLDGHIDHRRANTLYAKGCSHIEAIVLGYEIWSMLEPNAVFDVTDYLEQKLALIRNYSSQLRTVDYVQYASGLAHVRGYHAAIRDRRSGAAEAFVALPNKDYCDLVMLQSPIDCSAIKDTRVR
jgi:LmbE family N-acetylglucosaminyl deacetylase